MQIRLQKQQKPRKKNPAQHVFELEPQSVSWVIVFIQNLYPPKEIPCHKHINCEGEGEHDV